METSTLLVAKTYCILDHSSSAEPICMVSSAAQKANVLRTNRPATCSFWYEYHSPLHPHHPALGLVFLSHRAIGQKTIINTLQFLETLHCFRTPNKQAVVASVNDHDASMKTMRISCLWAALSTTLISTCPISSISKIDISDPVGAMISQY